MQGTTILPSPRITRGKYYSSFCSRRGQETALNTLLLMQARGQVIAGSLGVSAIQKTKRENGLCARLHCRVVRNWSNPVSRHWFDWDLPTPQRGGLCAPRGLASEILAEMERKGEAQHQKSEPSSCFLQTLGVIFIFLKSTRVAPIHEKLLWGRFYLHFYFQLGSVHLWYNCEQLCLCSSHKDKRPDFNLNSGKAPIKQAKC